MYRLLMHRVLPFRYRRDVRLQANNQPSRIACACGNHISKQKSIPSRVNSVSTVRRRNYSASFASQNSLMRKKRARKLSRIPEHLEVAGSSSCDRLTSVNNHYYSGLNRFVHTTETASIISTNNEKQNHFAKMAMLKPFPDEQENFQLKQGDEMIDIPSELREEDIVRMVELETAHLADEEQFAFDKRWKSDTMDDYYPKYPSFDPNLNNGEEKVIKKIDESTFNELLREKKHQGKIKLKKEEGIMKTVSNEDFYKTKLNKFEQAFRDENFTQNALAYIDACVHSGFLNRGMNALLLYRYRRKRSSLSHPEFKLYEALLHGYAGKKNISKIDEIMKMLQEDGIIPTAQCYAACFECWGRRISDSGRGTSKCDSEMYIKKKLHILASDMVDKGWNLNDIFAKTYLISDQMPMVLAAVHKLDPKFSPVWSPCPELGYDCRILQKLNEYQPNSGYSSPVEGLFSCKDLKKYALEQLENESKDCIEIRSIEKRADPDETVLFYRNKLEESQQEWRKVIWNALNRDLQSLQHRCQRGVFASRSMNLYPFLASLKKEELVDLVLQEIRKLAEGSETFSPTTNQLYRELGSRVLERYQVRWKEKNGILDKVKLLYGKYCEWFADPENCKVSPNEITCTRQAWQGLVHYHQNEGASMGFRERHWPVAVQMGIGKFLYGIILGEIRIDINVSRPNNKKSHLLPAFYTLFRTQHLGKFLKEEVKPHPALARLFRAAASHTLRFPAKCVPMVCPPIPWTTVISGGYLLNRADVVRLPQQAVLQWKRLMKCPTQQLYPALDSLNQLGAVPWKVNKPVLDLVIEVFNSGGSSELSIPAPPSSFIHAIAQTHLNKPSISLANPGTETPSQNASIDPVVERLKLDKQRMLLRRKRAEAYSLWCDTLYRLSLANHFRDRVFWLPHNMDFRGRVYPCPPHLNHLGSDVARSLLCFARGQPLGPKGFDWLKLHLVNLTGIMKHNSVAERMIFAEEMMPEILDSAEKPLMGRKWWVKSDEPWQTLAVCIEISNALKYEGGPENYICHFPVHQDGSCNGLQHYAALGRDAAGAASVSMAPSDRPQDVYGVVASMVERERAADAKNGIELAKILDGFVRRKVIKQTVMTTVYGVTRFGARLQIARQLRDIEEFPQEYVWRASAYLVEKTFGCLREMFTSTKEIQDWFVECARLISQVSGQSVEWVTPLGLPVVQPYNKIIGPKRYGPGDPLCAGFQKLSCGVGNYERPNIMKQRNAFPPNFIHSIDSSHMMLTSLWCERKGLTFVSVHDCYWTHPSTVETMNKVCREQFVALHSEPILEDLSKFLLKNYGYSEDELSEDDSTMSAAKRKLNQVLKQVPQKGDFDLRSVLDSVYFFS